CASALCGRWCDCFWQPGQEYLSWSFPAELGFLAHQELPVNGATDAAIHGGLLQHLEPHEFRESSAERREFFGGIVCPHQQHGRHAALDPVPAEVFVLVS